MGARCSFPALLALSCLSSAAALRPWQYGDGDGGVSSSVTGRLVGGQQVKLAPAFSILPRCSRRVSPLLPSGVHCQHACELQLRTSAAYFLQQTESYFPVWRHTAHADSGADCRPLRRTGPGAAERVSGRKRHVRHRVSRVGGSGALDRHLHRPLAGGDHGGGHLCVAVGVAPAVRYWGPER